MRILLVAAAIGSIGAIALPAAPASAQYRGHYDRNVQREVRECRRELRRADSRREYRRELAECRREINRARWQSRYDHRRYDRYDRRSYRHGYRDRW